METTIALLVIALVLGFGDFISIKTKALLSMIFIAGLVFMVGFWLFLPKTLFQDAHIIDFAYAIIPLLLVYMGTLMKLKDLKGEWKTVIIALSAIMAAAVILFFIASPIIGSSFAIGATGPISGGVVSTIIMQEAADAKGLETITVFVTVLLVLQSFVGLPIASYCLSGEAKNLIKKFRENGGAANKENLPPVESSERQWYQFPQMPQKFQTPFILLMKTFLVAWLAIYAAELMGGVINKYVLALVFGIIFYELGFLEQKVLDRANSAGITLFALMVPVFASLPKATPEMIGSFILPIVIVFALSVVGISIISFVLGKILGYSWQLSLAVGVTCLFGFPGTFIVAEEISDAVSESAEERDYLASIILPKMLVGGFSTVTIGSVFVASFMVNFL
jgi:ABC-type multidrug transport system fused ATPase/permease subunit